MGITDRVPLLTGEWRYLILLNYAVDEGILAPHLPAGTELDRWEGRPYVSLVGFMFLNSRAAGVPILTDLAFEEINLRFYVRRKAEEGWRHGVVFVREIVSRPLIGKTANLLYGEHYVIRTTRHHLDLLGGGFQPGGLVQYEWEQDGRWNGLSARAQGKAYPIFEGSHEEFFLESYWGYTKQVGVTTEYRVFHPKWFVWQAGEPRFECHDIAAAYGPEFAEALSGPPTTAMLAEGSPISVYLQHPIH